MTHKVLVILASYNGRNWIVQQIDSILDQINVSVEIFICDDQSSDDSVELLRSTYSDECRVKLYSADSSSGSAGANFCRAFIRCAPEGYDYVALADQDDVWFAEKIVRAINQLRGGEFCGYSAAVVGEWEDGRKKVLRQSPRITSLDFLFEGAGQGCTFVLPLAVFRSVRDFCIQNSEIIARFHYHDWLIYLIVRMNSGPWFFDQQPAMMYRQHASNEIGARGTFGSFASRVTRLRNGWYKRQITVAIFLCRKVAHSPEVEKFAFLFEGKPSFWRACHLVRYMLKGRRRWSDRAVLAVAAALGWI